MMEPADSVELEDGEHVAGSNSGLAATVTRLRRRLQMMQQNIALMLIYATVFLDFIGSKQFAARILDF